MSRLLFATSALDPDRTSGGIGACHLVLALHDAGHAVRVLTTDRVPSHLLPVPVETLPNEMDGRRPGHLRRRASVRLTGYPPEAWRQIAAWEAALAAGVERFMPDAVFAMGAGGNLFALMALARAAPDCPWIANYHDPYPASLRPGAYRRSTRWVSGRQERMHRLILRRADALTFPSARLLRWVLGDESQGACVLPHIASDLAHRCADRAPQPAVDPARPFRLVHAGTLLGPRSPHGLLEGLDRFFQQVPEARERTVLAQIGTVHHDHQALPAWKRLVAAGVLKPTTERVSYGAACAAMRSAAATVVVEADMPMSPFLPQKLADAVALQRPVLALTPRASAVSDLLGADHPLRVDPTDADGVARALAMLWTKRGEDAILVPAEGAAQLAPTRVVESFEHTLARIAR